MVIQVQVEQIEQESIEIAKQAIDNVSKEISTLIEKEYNRLYFSPQRVNL